MAISLAESAASVWQQSELDFRPSSFPKSSLTAVEFFLNTGPASPTWETSDGQTSLFGEVESTFLALAFPASQQAWPGSEKAKMMTVGSGRQLSMLLNLSSRLGAFSKILLESSAWTSSEEFCYVWNRLDTKFACSAFQLTPLGLVTEGSESSLLGTPDASHAAGPNGGASTLKNTLCRMTLWPTPRADDDGRTPEAHLAMRAKQGSQAVTSLSVAAKLWPTPRSEGFDAEGLTHSSLQAEVKKAEASQGSLNPRFVEELMGFPIDHTALKR
jgi:hypothetical protein